jgi:hypothetical protein
MNFEGQINEIRVPCIINYFKDKNLLNFLKMHINIDNLLQNYKNKNNNPLEKKSLCEKLIEIEQLTDDLLIKELISTIQMQICDNVKCDKVPILIQIPSIKLDNILLEKFNKIFPTSNIEIDVNEHFNIFKLIENNKPDIYIYSHILDINIPNEIVDEFYKLTKEKNSCAILCNRNYGIYNKSSFEIDIQDNNVNMFIPNYNENDQFNTAIQIIYHIYENVKDNTGCIEIDKDLLQKLKLEYSYFLTMHNKYLSSMKGNIMSLEKLQLIQLDHFFKRTHINSEDKPYGCQLCGTKFGTDKSLKSHLKIKHQIQLGKTRNKKIKETEDENEDENNGLMKFD